MNQTEQRIAILKAAGWRVDFTENAPKNTCPYELIRPDGVREGYAFDEETLWKYHAPNPTIDLNAMNAPLNALSLEQRIAWLNHVDQITLRRSNEWFAARCAMATAAEFAEAYLRTLGLWKEAA